MIVRHGIVSYYVVSYKREQIGQYSSSIYEYHCQLGLQSQQSANQIARMSVSLSVQCQSVTADDTVILTMHSKYDNDMTKWPRRSIPMHALFTKNGE